jgi:hypothetical protein
MEAKKAKATKVKKGLPLVNFKAKPKEIAALKANAKAYGYPSLSEWIRSTSGDPRLLKDSRVRVKKYVAPEKKAA